MKVPDVLVLLVHVAQAREKATELGREAIGQRGQNAVGLLDRHGVLRRQRDDQVAGELVVDVGGDRELRFAERKAALARTDVAACGKAADRVLLGILRQVGVAALKHGRNRRIERGKTARRRRCRRRGRPEARRWRRAWPMPPRHPSAALRATGCALRSFPSIAGSHRGFARDRRRWPPMRAGRRTAPAPKRRAPRISWTR